MNVIVSPGHRAQAREFECYCRVHHLLRTHLVRPISVVKLDAVGGTGDVSGETSGETVRAEDMVTRQADGGGIGSLDRC